MKTRFLSNRALRISASAIIFIAMGASMTACKKGPASGEAPKTEQDKTLYALGYVLGKNIEVFNLSAQELAAVSNGLKDGAAKAEAKVDLETYGPKIQQLAQERVAAGAEKEKKSADAFLTKAAKEPGAETKPSGLIFRSITEGTGASPTAESTVKVHYEGKLVDGTVFDSSVQRGEPVEFQLSQVIPCWTEGVQLMKAGQKAQLVCPSAIAYGDQGRPPTIPGGATLIFEVELLEVK